MAKVTSSPTHPQPETMTLVSTDGLLRVEFRWHHDRYQHFFLAGHQSLQGATPITDTAAGAARQRESLLGQSVEGDSENDWPPSPPIQQLSAEIIDGRNVLLGVGAAGQSHWSISVETRSVDDVATLKFDLACRCKTSPKGLGSTYQIDPTLTIEPLNSTVLEGGGRSVTIRPAMTESTYRWSYGVRRHA